MLGMLAVLSTSTNEWVDVCRCYGLYWPVVIDRANLQKVLV